MSNDLIFLIPHSLERKDMVSDAINSIGDHSYIICEDKNKNGPAYVLQKNFYIINKYFKNIAILDDDDILFYEEFEKMLSNHMKGNYPFSYSSYIRSDTKETVSYKIVNIRKKFGSRGLKIYNTEMLEKLGGFDPTIKVHYDYDVCLRLWFSFGEPYFHEKPCFLYRIHDNQITKRMKDFGKSMGNWISKRPVYE